MRDQITREVVSTTNVYSTYFGVARFGAGDGSANTLSAPLRGVENIEKLCLAWIVLLFLDETEKS